MIELLFMIIFSFLNIVGIMLWISVFILMTEVLLCRDAKEINFKRIFSRRLCFTLRKFKRSLESSFYVASLIFWIAASIVLYYRVTEISMHVTSISDYGRTLSSILLPVGLIIIYRYMGHRISVFN